jgi:hypothetical protein
MPAGATTQSRDRRKARCARCGEAIGVARWTASTALGDRCSGRAQWVLPLPGRGQYMCVVRAESGVVVDGLSQIAHTGDDSESTALGSPGGPYAVVFSLAPSSRSCSEVDPGASDELQQRRQFDTGVGRLAKRQRLRPSSHNPVGVFPRFPRSPCCRRAVIRLVTSGSYRRASITRARVTARSASPSPNPWHP